MRSFSLIELLVVIFLIGLILGLTFISIDDMTSPSRVAATARRLADTLAMARNEAASQGRVFRIHYDLQKQFYWLEIPKNTEFLTPEEKAVAALLGEQETEESEEPIALPEVYLKEGISFEDIMFSETAIKRSGEVFVDFTPFGFSAGHIIHLKTNEGQQFSVEINGLTGVASVYDFYKKFEQFVVYTGD